MTTVEFSVEVDAPPERVWEVTSNPRNLPYWDKHIESAHVAREGLGPGARYEVTMRFMAYGRACKSRCSSGSRRGARCSILCPGCSRRP